MQTGELLWTWRDRAVRIGVSRLGAGPPVLLLPALSSISTRAEMHALQTRLAGRFATVSVDWPGFGGAPAPQLDYGPALYAAFLRDLLSGLLGTPFATIAAGHAAGYLLAQAAAAPGSAGRLCLIAPTWRGPLPTMLGRRPQALAALARAAERPVLGPLLYRLNVNRLSVPMMARGHVYADPAWFDPPRRAAKLALTRAPGARHAAWRFVAGALDPFADRAEFLAAAERVRDPVGIVSGAATPRKSAGEIAALSALPGMQAVVLPAGKLAVHEEFPDSVADALGGFLDAAA